VCTFEKVLFIFIFPMATWASAVSPEPPPVHILPNWRKSLAHFCKPFLLSMHDVLPSVCNGCGGDKLLAVETEAWFSALFSVCCKPLTHLSFLDVFPDRVECVPRDFPIVNPDAPFMVRNNPLWW
jgi:hypothetical protein